MLERHGTRISGPEEETPEGKDCVLGSVVKCAMC